MLRLVKKCGSVWAKTRLKFREVRRTRVKLPFANNRTRQNGAPKKRGICRRRRGRAVIPLSYCSAPPMLYPENFSLFFYHYKKFRCVRAADSPLHWQTSQTKQSNRFAPTHSHRGPSHAHIQPFHRAYSPPPRTTEPNPTKKPFTAKRPHHPSPSWREKRNRKSMRSPKRAILPLLIPFARFSRATMEPSKRNFHTEHFGETSDASTHFLHTQQAMTNPFRWKIPLCCNPIRHPLWELSLSLPITFKYGDFRRHFSGSKSLPRLRNRP